MKSGQINTIVEVRKTIQKNGIDLKAAAGEMEV